MSIRRIGPLAAVAVSAVLLGRFWAGQAVEPSHGGAIPNEVSPGEDALRSQLQKQNDLLAQMTARLSRLEHERQSAPEFLGGGRDRSATADTGARDSGAPHQRMTVQQIREEQSARETAAKEAGLQRLATIGKSWEREPVDPGWADRYEMDVRAALGSSEFDSVSLVDVDCRSNLCKLELSADPDTDASELSVSLTQLKPFQNTEFTTTKPEGGDAGQILIYLARPGGEGLAQHAASGS
jgi:hypothetical protein